MPASDALPSIDAPRGKEVAHKAAISSNDGKMLLLLDKISSR
jgi:hypothetical protein